MVIRRTTGNSDSQDSSWLGLGGSHHLPPYNILCASSQGSHLNGILSRDSQVRIPKFSQLRLLQFWGPISLHVNLGLRWGLKQSCRHCQKISKGLSQATCTQGNQVNSWLLVVGSQIVNLTLSLSFGHNLCFRCPNGSCEPILDIYVLIVFQWYKELFNPLGFNPWNCSLNIRGSTETPTPKVGIPLGVWGSIPSHFLAFPGACGMTPRLPSWPATLQALALVASPRLRLQQKTYSKTKKNCHVSKGKGEFSWRLDVLCGGVFLGGVVNMNYHI